MAAIRCLHTRYFMYSRGIARTARCPHGCRESETEEHILWRCKVAQDIWLMISAFLTRLTGSAAMTLQSILFGPLQGLRSHQDRNAWRVINATKQTIWEIRNKKVFHKQDTPPIITARILPKCIKDYISLETHSLGKETANINWNITTLQGTFITPPNYQSAQPHLYQDSSILNPPHKQPGRDQEPSRCTRPLLQPCQLLDI
ncbi:hypothetical protein DPEC_G00310980 [Dallia pectoralis]|uniref:Uncharacterized protein n=1 Tax=Dallia pectoralis TaxID=75939 RepID=A0ACC2FBC7_DALPE|nr:hypothetical protein DPEC_G00310980 [Dallia pectoralis]